MLRNGVTRAVAATCMSVGAALGACTTAAALAPDSGTLSPEDATASLDAAGADGGACPGDADSPPELGCPCGTPDATACGTGPVPETLACTLVTPVVGTVYRGPVWAWSLGSSCQPGEICQPPGYSEPAICVPAPAGSQDAGPEANAPPLSFPVCATGADCPLHEVCIYLPAPGPIPSSKTCYPEDGGLIPCGTRADCPLSRSCCTSVNDAGYLSGALCGGTSCEPGSLQLCFPPDDCPAGYACDYVFPQTPTPVCHPLDAGLPDPPGEAGPDVADSPPSSLIPCTQATGTTGCVACSGNASGQCTPTEAVFVAHDIATGVATAPGPDPANSCYSCLWNSGCLDDSVYDDTGQECEDPMATFGTSADCQRVLSCILASSCASRSITDCYCGTASVAGACQANPGAINGVCSVEIATGLGFAVTDGTDNTQNLTDSTRAAGRADRIFQCALSNQCRACLQ
jgi:hypothetical protein